MINPLELRKLMKGENAWDSKENDFISGFEYKFPLYISPKIDGIRCGVQQETALTYTGKLLKNDATREQLSLEMYNGLDFELTDGLPYGDGVFSRAQKAFMKKKGSPEFSCHIFDDFTNPDAPYSERLAKMKERVDILNSNFFGRDPFRIVPQYEVNSVEEVLYYDELFLSEGYEGSMTRVKNGRNKAGRSTLREQLLLKLKRFCHTEAVIVGYEEEMENTNPTIYDVYGKAIKSNTKDAKSGKGRLGKYLCRCPEYEEVFAVSCTTMPHEERLKRWQTAHLDVGKYIRFKHLKHGEKDKPRHGMFAGFRDPDDFIEKGHEF